MARNPVTRTITRRLFTLFPMLALSPRLHALYRAGQSGFFPRKSKSQPAPPPNPFVYFGTDTDKPGAKGIYVSRFDVQTGQLTAPVLAATSLRPSYLALNQMRSNGSERPLIYAANEGPDAKSSGVSTYLIDPATGMLTLLGHVSSADAGPCYIAVDTTHRAAFIANYSGSIVSYLVRPDGTLSDPIAHIDFHQPGFGHRGPNASRQDAPHPHSSMLSPDNRFLIVNDLGHDDIVIFPIDAQTAKLGKPSFNPNRIPGSGPRHVAFHPNGRWAYGIDELANRIDQYLWNTTQGSSTTEPEARLTDTGRSASTLDPAFHGTNTAAEIVVSPAGNFLYTSNRGEDSLAVFAIDAANGAPTSIGRIPCGGKAPRHFTLDPSARWLLCGNQDSASITVFARDALTGKLSGPVQTLPLESPLFTLFA